MTKVSSDMAGQAGAVLMSDLPLELSDEEVAEFAIELGRLWNASEIELARVTGERIITRLFRGSVEFYREYNRGFLSLDRIVGYLRQNEFEGWNRARVDNSVIVYDLGEKLGGFGQFDNLGVTHLLAVAGLPVEEQRALLTEANAKGMLASELEEKVRSRRKGQQRNEGKDLSLIRRALARVGGIERALKGREDWLQDVTAAGLDDGEVQRFGAVLDACAQQARRVADELAKKLPPKKKR